MTVDVVSTSLISTSLITRARGVALCVLAGLSLAASSACGADSEGGGDARDSRGVVVVNAPASGEVRRVLAREGMRVAEGDPVLEIVVRAEGLAAPRATPEDPVARAGQAIQSSAAEVEAARAEVVRTEVEVQRLTPLVASGSATQGELDGARALYDRAQQRLRQAQSAEQGAQGGLVAARRQAQGGGPAAAATPAERVVTARATSAGTVSVVSARVGDRVIEGQPVATLRAN